MEVYEHLAVSTSTEDFFNRIAADYTVRIDMSRAVVGQGGLTASGTATPAEAVRYVAVKKALHSYAKAYPGDKWLASFADADIQYDGRASGDKVRRAVNSVLNIKRQEAKN